MHPYSVNWRAVLEAAGCEVVESGIQLSCLCPFCNHHRISLYVSPTGLWTCQYCHRRGNGYRLLKLLREASLLNETFKVAPTLAGEAKSVVNKSVQVNLPDEFELLDKVTVGSKRFWSYTERRHLTVELVKQYGIGFCRSGSYGGRLVIPVTYQSELVSFVARDITNTQPLKIMTPLGNKQSECLFNLDRICGSENVVIVEGVFDCLVIPDIAVASFGKRLTHAQAALIVQSGFKEVIICWDADASQEAEEAAARLSPFVEARVALLRQGDPSELGRDIVLEAVAQAALSTPMKRTANRV